MKRTIAFALALAVSLAGCTQHRDENALAAKQAEVIDRGRSVMPFDINRTMHHFQKTPDGGVQQVLSTDRDPHQVALVREHLRMEAARFQAGDFSDPATIHGAGMPGVKALAAGFREIKVGYSDVQAGGRITYTTANPTLVSAIHSWFDAQVHEHGRHAMSM